MPIAELVAPTGKWASTTFFTDVSSKLYKTVTVFEVVQPVDLEKHSEMDFDTCDGDLAK